MTARNRTDTDPTPGTDRTRIMARTWTTPNGYRATIVPHVDPGHVGVRLGDRDTGHLVDVLPLAATFAEAEAFADLFYETDE